MSDEKTGNSLPQQSVPYYRALWQRVWSDIRQALEARVKVAVVTAISAALNACVIAYYAGGPGEMSVALYSGFFAVATLCGTLATTLLGYFLFYYFVVTPSRIYGENQKEITELKSQLDRRLDLDVNVPFVLPIPTENFPTLRHLGRGGVVILLQGLRITNRSKTHNVSLSLTLRVRMDDFLKYGDDIESPDYVPCYSYKEHHQGLTPGEFLFNAINIGPERTESGDMCFPVPAAILNVHGANKVVNHHSCLLDIIDHVSGEGITKNIDQRFLESPTAQLVK